LSAVVAATVQEADGIPSIASASVIQFDQAAGFRRQNPSGSIAQIDSASCPSPSGHRAIDGGGGDSDTPRRNPVQ